MHQVKLSACPSRHKRASQKCDNYAELNPPAFSSRQAQVPRCRSPYPHTISRPPDDYAQDPAGHCGTPDVGAITLAVRVNTKDGRNVPRGSYVGWGRLTRTLFWSEFLQFHEFTDRWSCEMLGVGRALLMKRPYNLFHRANLSMHLQDVKRSFGNP